MKIALQFFGHLRTFRETFQSWEKHFLFNKDVDIFIHTWKDSDHIDLSHHNNYGLVFDSKYEILDIIGGDSRFKEILIDEPIENEWKEKYIFMSDSKIHIKSIASQYKSKEKVNSLRKQYSKKNNLFYDIVILTRPDIYLKSKLYLPPIESCDMCLHIASSPWTGCFNLLEDLSKKEKDIFCGATDLLLYGTEKILDSYIDVNKSCLNDYVKLSLEENNKKHIYGLENYPLQKGIKNNIFNINFLNFYYLKNWEILREKNLTFFKKNESISKKITIVISFVGHDWKLKRCLLSVLKQYYSNLEVLLVDSRPMIQPVKNELEKLTLDSRITYLKNESGYIKNIKHIIEKHITGIYVLFLDTTEYLHRYTISNLVSSLEKNDGKSICFNFILVEKDKFTPNTDNLKFIENPPILYEISEFYENKEKYDFISFNSSNCCSLKNLKKPKIESEITLFRTEKCRKINIYRNIYKNITNFSKKILTRIFFLVFYNNKNKS